MVAAIKRWYRNRVRNPYVRPWGLAAPILVLIVCLPLLRPLRRVVPLIGNIDLSPLVLFILLRIGLMLVTQLVMSLA